MHGTFVTVEAGDDLPDGIWTCSGRTKITAKTKLIVMKTDDGYDIRTFNPNDDAPYLVHIVPDAQGDTLVAVDGRGHVNLWANHWVGCASDRLSALRDVVASDRPRKTAKDAIARLA